MSSVPAVELRDEPEACRIARHALLSYFQERAVAYGPDIAPAGLDVPAPVFVSLWSGPHLRGCMGTRAPMMPTAAREIGIVALQAATADPLRRPLHRAELAGLEIGVAVLGPRREGSAEPDEAVEVEVPAGPGALVLPGCGGVPEARRGAGLAPDVPLRVFARTVVAWGRQPTAEPPTR